MDTTPLGALVADKDGNLYGTTQAGGAGYHPCGSGCGIFEIKPPTVTGSHLAYSLLYRFRELSATDGVEPVSPLILYASGKLYGGAWFGGDPAGEQCLNYLRPRCNAAPAPKRS